MQPVLFLWILNLLLLMKFELATISIFIILKILFQARQTLRAISLEENTQLGEICLTFAYKI